ncbi:Aldo/keto reductase [Mycena vulgaris]|nr:Aldo/keto reductase [Mycena vulgaris]
MATITLTRTDQAGKTIDQQGELRLLSIPRRIFTLVTAQMPLVGFGLWKVPKDTCADTVFNAIKAGYRLFDGAGDYGNEKEAGEGVARALKAGIVKREDLFITSKLWNTFHRKDHVEVLARKQLELWGLDYFDLFLVHFPIALEYVDPAERYPPEWFGADGKTVNLQDTPMKETWEAMEEIKHLGLANNIGISNCQGSLILDMFRYARIKPQELGIAITAYSSFGPQSYIELSMDRAAPSLFTHDHNMTPAQVLLRWATQRGIANLNSLSFDLTSEEMKAISGLNLQPEDIDKRMSIFA